MTTLQGGAGATVPHALELQGITKRYGDLVANDDVDFTLAAGEIHALVGENGAGKTTLMNICFGLETPDAGTLLVNGNPETLHHPADALRLGIAMVHQHFMLVPVFTVVENVVLGVEPAGASGTMDYRKARSRLLDLGRQYGLAVDPDARVEELSVGAQQRVEILKALYREARILILDEPTAVLTPQETDELCRVLRRLADEGAGIVLITHKLHEALAVADRITVLRRGRVVATLRPDETDAPQLAALMVGREVRLAGDSALATAVGTTIENGTESHPSLSGGLPQVGASEQQEPTHSPPGFGPPGERGVAADPSHSAASSDVGAALTEQLREPGRPTGTAPPTTPVLRAEGLVVRDARGLPAVDGVSFDVRRGEIFGIAGVQGNGQTELVEALVGLRPLAGGHVTWPGVTGPDPGPRTIREHGTAHIPEDRQRDGLLLNFSIADNLILCAADRAPFARWGQRIEVAILHHARALMRTFDIRAHSEHTPVETLSGGNQQKVILARELSGEVRLVIANQPTRGLDVGAVEEIHARLRALRAAGAGILLVSTELDELRALADRIAVLSRGRLVVTLPAAETTPPQLGLLMAGTAP